MYFIFSTNTMKTLVLFTIIGFVSSTPDLLADYECEPSDTGYIVPDPIQCDRYATCSKDGEKVIILCQDGLAFHDRRGICVPLNEAECTDRRALQEPNTEQGSLCRRLNGNFPYVKNEDIEDDTNECTHFFRCVNGVASKSYCPAGTTFDFDLLQCIHTERSTREECKASTTLNFKCPEVKFPFSKKHSPLLMRFGAHDRLAHPEDCSKFYVCLPNGQPILSSCPPPDVFNSKTGFCERYDTVENCEEFYIGTYDLSDIKINKISLNESF
ncbi:protein obstructor-E isoform X2 [Lepeophtheirus salmonis]|uniref:protein obstructor-E isoform X2 n=1 Tax=Lepeophtheirus salmonis TaxID=72036 RepID=UPI001AE853EB|nr:protein obstructor-E-like isoform X2 [Lepeophtheirus salmonis]